MVHLWSFKHKRSKRSAETASKHSGCAVPQLCSPVTSVVDQSWEAFSSHVAGLESRPNLFAHHMHRYHGLNFPSFFDRLVLCADAKLSSDVADVLSSYCLGLLGLHSLPFLSFLVRGANRLANFGTSHRYMFHKPSIYFNSATLCSGFKWQIASVVLECQFQIASAFYMP